jgi:hypothetical protein
VHIKKNKAKSGKIVIRKETVLNRRIQRITFTLKKAINLEKKTPNL